MPIPIHQEPDDELTRSTDREKCCFCRESTQWWTSLPDRKPGQQVACCPHCASRGEPSDVPTKVDWCRREKIAHHPTLGEVAQGFDREYPPAPVEECPNDTLQQPRSRQPRKGSRRPTASKARRSRDQV